MKKKYEAPDVQLVEFAADEQLALLDGHPDESASRRATRAGDLYNPSWGGVEVPDD